MYVLLYAAFIVHFALYLNFPARIVVCCNYCVVACYVRMYCSYIARFMLDV